MQKLKIATIGCGARARVYLSIIAKFTDQWEIVAGADPTAARVDAVRRISNNPNFQSFESDKELLSAPKLADIVIIATQDNYHYEPAKQALLKGYHLLLEKPAGQTLEESLELAELAKIHQRRVILCFVLRYTNLYRKVKEIVDSGKLGQIISLRASEGVGAWHQAHSYVRGHWNQSDECTPMIISKCTHDLDIIAWMMGQRCRRVSSFGSLSYFHPENKNPAHPDRCFDAADGAEECEYSAKNYFKEENKHWLSIIYPDPEGIEDTEKVKQWLANSKWGRNVFSCDNDVVDHQVVNMEFENGATAALTMTAFDEGRTLDIYGTKASLRAGDALRHNFNTDLVVRHHLSREVENVKIEDVQCEGYAGHGGGDFGLAQSLYDLVTSDDPDGTLEKSIESHRIGFAAEASRLAKGAPIELF